MGMPKAMGKLTGMRKPYGWGWNKPVLGASNPPGHPQGPPGSLRGLGGGLAPQRPPDTPIAPPGTGRGRERPGGVVVTF